MRKELNMPKIMEMIYEYDKHKNDPYAYSPDEIDAVREIHSRSREIIEYLLDRIDDMRDGF